MLKKPPHASKKKVWICPGCGEVFKNPMVKDWIQCKICQEWWHEKCTNYLGSGDYKYVPYTTHCPTMWCVRTVVHPSAHSYTAGCTRVRTFSFLTFFILSCKWLELEV